MLEKFSAIFRWKWTVRTLILRLARNVKEIQFFFLWFLLFNFRISKPLCDFSKEIYSLKLINLNLKTNSRPLSSSIHSIHIKLHVPQMVKQHTHTRTIFKTQYVRPNHIYHYHHKPRKYRGYDNVLQSLASGGAVPEIHTIEPIGGGFNPRKKKKWSPNRNQFKQMRILGQLYRISPNRYRSRNYMGYGYGRGDNLDYDDHLQMAGTQLDPTEVYPIYEGITKDNPTGGGMRMIRITAADHIQPKEIPFNLRTYDLMSTAPAMSPFSTQSPLSATSPYAINYAGSPTTSLTHPGPPTQTESTTHVAQAKTSTKPSSVSIWRASSSRHWHLSIWGQLPGRLTKCSVID